MEGVPGEKNISMSIKVSEGELEMFKRNVKLFSYSFYSEFVCRTALIGATKVMKETKQESCLECWNVPRQRPALKKVGRLTNEY